MTLHILVMRYSCFAVLAIILNLAVQRLVLAVAPDAIDYMAALVCGTGAGLVLKYVLDKRWIFNDLSTDLKSHTRKFTLYTVMGLVTTAIFWGTETGFWVIWHTDIMREMGAALGLGIGYVVKYHLDRRFVFTDHHLGESKAL